MVTIASPLSPHANDSEQRRRKQTLERAKANHLSRQLQMRLQYARLKVEHGWQRQNLNEVENLYFHHSAVGRNPRPSSVKVSHLAALPVTTCQPPTGLGVAFAMSADTAVENIQVTDLSTVNMFASNSEVHGVEEELGRGAGLETVINDDSQLNPRILQESPVEGGYFASEQRDLVPLLESQLGSSPQIQELPSTPAVSTLLPSTTSPANISFQLPNLQQPQPTPLPQPQRFQPALRLSRPEVSIPDLPSLAGPRSESTSPWSRITNITAINSSNASASSGGRPGGGNGNGDINNSGFGNSALTYDSFWSGFRGSTTPTASTTPTSTAHPTPISGRTRGGGSGSLTLTPGTAAGSPFDMGMGTGTGIGIGVGNSLGLGQIEVVEGGGSYVYPHGQ